MFQSFNRYLGVGVGEHLGYGLTGIWTTLIGIALIDSSVAADWLGVVGVLIGRLFLLCSLQFIGRTEDRDGGSRPADPDHVRRLVDLADRRRRGPSRLTRASEKIDRQVPIGNGETKECDNAYETRTGFPRSTYVASNGLDARSDLGGFAFPASQVFIETQQHAEPRRREQTSCPARSASGLRAGSATASAGS